MTKSKFIRGGLVGFLLALLLACSPPRTAPPVSVERMPNTPAGIAACHASGGTPLRDPQPPRPVDQPGPTFICKRIG